jgi:hypothetical protein
LPKWVSGIFYNNTPPLSPGLGQNHLRHIKTLSYAAYTQLAQKEPIALFGEAPTAKDPVRTKKIFLPDSDEKQPFAGSKKHMFANLRPERQNEIKQLKFQ